MKALRRAMDAWGLLLALWFLQLGVASLLALPVRTAVAAALGKHHDLLDPARALAAIADLGIQHPAALAQLEAGVVTTAIIGALFWLVASGAILTRLDRRIDPPETFAASIRHLPAVVGATLWHLPLRALLAGLPLTLGPVLSRSWLVVALAVGWCLGTSTLDAARAQAVLAGTTVRRPTAVIRGLQHLVRRPSTLAASLALGLVGWCLVLAALYIALWGLAASGTLFAVRGMALLTAAVGLWRVALAVELTRQAAPQATPEPD